MCIYSTCTNTTVGVLVCTVQFMEKVTFCRLTYNQLTVSDNGISVKSNAISVTG